MPLRKVHTSDKKLDYSAFWKRTKMAFTRSVILIVLVVGVFGSANGQDYATPPGVIAGPYGKPLMILDDTDTWQEPVEVFANSEMEVFIPDITGPSWAAWHVKRVGAQDFSYFLYVYTFYPLKRAIGKRDLIFVDTSKPNSVLWQNMFQRGVIDTTKNRTIAQIVAKITELVKPEAERQPSEAANLQNYIQQNERAALKMALCSGPGNMNPDCNLSDSDFQKKYPIHPRPTPQLKPGAIPGVNCGVGTNTSCCCADANDNMLPTAGDTSGKEPSSEPSAEGLYRIGNYVSAPIPIVSPEAEFTDEARRTKYQGVCLVSLIVDAQGNPQNPRVIRAVGHGLDEKALEAVRKYKFKPALIGGKYAVPVMITIEVNFRLY